MPECAGAMPPPVLVCGAPPVLVCGAPPPRPLHLPDGSGLICSSTTGCISPTKTDCGIGALLAAAGSADLPTLPCPAIPLNGRICISWRPSLFRGRTSSRGTRPLCAVRRPPCCVPATSSSMTAASLRCAGHRLRRVRPGHDDVGIVQPRRAWGLPGHGELGDGPASASSGIVDAARRPRRGRPGHGELGTARPHSFLEP
jgi:hypothetical protein